MIKLKSQTFGNGEAKEEKNLHNSDHHKNK